MMFSFSYIVLLSVACDGLYLVVYLFSGESLVLDHSVSQSSKNPYSRTQTVEGGRCVNEQGHVGMRQS